MSADSPRGYHGYWAQDLYAINSNYGTADDLKSLVNTAHDKVSAARCDAILIDNKEYSVVTRCTYESNVVVQMVYWIG